MSARDVPSDLVRATELTATLWAAFLRPPPRQTVTEWAEANRILSGKDSSEPGKYRAARTQHAIEPQDALSPDSGVSKVVLVWGAQTGKSTIGMNWIGSQICNRPGPLMIVQPTLDTAKRFSRQRVAPMIDSTAALKKAVRENRSRDEANTIALKEFAGGFLAIAGANSAAGLRSMPVRDLFLDEIDAYPADVDGEGDPVALATARQTTFASRKQLVTSTPTIKGQSPVEAEFLASDQRYYHVACPHCGEFQALEWGAETAHGLKWQKNAEGKADPATAHYVCKHNGCVIEEHHKPHMFASGKWLAQNPSAPGHVRGYHLNSLYSPLGWASWAMLAEEWLHATAKAKEGDTSRLQTFLNTRLALTWEEKGRGAEATTLHARAEHYPPGIVPRGGLMLTMGVDVQPDRLEARVWSYGRGEESWLVERHVIYGDPNVDEYTDGSPWATLSKIRSTPLTHAVGNTPVLIEVTGIDTGGHNTQAVYNYCRVHSSARVLAFKGSSQSKQPILGKAKAVDVTYKGKPLARGVKLWSVGTDTAKDLLYGRMRIVNAGPGYVHVPAVYKATDEFEQMTAERLLPVVRNGKHTHAWVNPAGKRNEASDCMVYAYAAAMWLKVNTMSEGSWARREAQYCPQGTQDLFSQSNHANVSDSTDSVAIKNEPKTSPQPPSRLPRPFSRDW